MPIIKVKTSMLNDGVRIENAILSPDIKNGGNTISGSVVSLGTETLYQTAYTGNASGTITFSGGESGRTYRVLVTSNGRQYYLGIDGGTISWPSSITPVPSVSGQIDMYELLFTSTTKALGMFAFDFAP